MFTTKRLLGAAMALAVCLLSGVGVADAAAASGDRVQKPGAAGCLSMIGFCERGVALDGAESITVSPYGTSAYVASSSADAVAVFDRAGDGTLTQKPGPAGCVSDTGAGRCRDGTALDFPESVAVSPDGQSVYVASGGADAVAVFDRTPGGRLVQKPGTAGCISNTGAGSCVDGTALDFPRSVTVSPDGQSVYVAGSTSNAVAVFDRAGDGSLTQKRGTAGCISDTGTDGCTAGRGLTFAKSVTVSPEGRSVYVASRIGAVAVFDRTRSGRLIQKPGTSGCISNNGDGGCINGVALRTPDSVAVSPDGRSAYVAASTSNAVAVFDRAPNGTLAQRPGTAGCIREATGANRCGDGSALAGAASVAVSPDGQSAYIASRASGAVAVFDREPSPPPVEP